jgi:hypothetical protein
MEKIMMNRGFGKTHQLIKKSSITGDCIVCKDFNESSRIFDVAQQMGLKIPMPISFHEFLRGEYSRRGIKGFLIDNADLLLKYISNVPITAITLSTNGS